MTLDFPGLAEFQSDISCISMLTQAHGRGKDATVLPLKLHLQTGICQNEININPFLKKNGCDYQITPAIILSF